MGPLRPNGLLRFGWVRAPTSAGLAGLSQILARRSGRFLERQGVLERGAEQSCLAGDVLEAGPDGSAPALVDGLPHHRRAAAGSEGIHATDADGM